MQQTEQSEATDDTALDPAISLMCDLIEAMCISEDDVLIEAGKAHTAISAPLFGVKADDDGDGLGFLKESKSWALGGTQVPDLPPLKERAPEEYMYTLKLHKFDTNGSIRIISEPTMRKREYPTGSQMIPTYEAECIKCGKRFTVANKMFFDGLSKWCCDRGKRWVSASEISLDVSGHYSSGAKVIPKTRTYAPK